MNEKLDDVGGAADIAKQRIKVARENLESAIRNASDEDYKTANNRAYYAIFRAASACQALNFEAYKSHGKTIGAFNRKFVHEEKIFPEEIGKRISKAQKVRHKSDYDDFYIVSKEETREQIKTAEDFIKMAEKYIEDQTKNK